MDEPEFVSCKFDLVHGPNNDGWAIPPTSPFFGPATRDVGGKAGYLHSSLVRTCDEMGCQDPVLLVNYSKFIKQVASNISSAEQNHPSRQHAAHICNPEDIKPGFRVTY